MQPHSVVGASVISYIWNGNGPHQPKTAQVDVEYRTKDGTFRKLIYDVDIYELSHGGSRARMRIGRSDFCVIVAQRNSTAEGSKIAQEHETQHVSGLREEYQLWHKRLGSGIHYNSQKYRNFSADISSADPKRMTFYSEMLKDKNYIPLRFDVEIKSIT